MQSLAATIVHSLIYDRLVICGGVDPKTFARRMRLWWDYNIEDKERCLLIRLGNGRSRESNI